VNWIDRQDRYGPASRAFHWGMAALLAWQFASAMAHKFIEDTAVEQFLWSTHRPLGVLILILLVLRGIWAVSQRANRPPSVHWPALTGQITLYLLTFLVPFIALLRQYGSGRSFEPFGIPLFSGWEGQRIDWMVSLGGLLHGELGWVLLALIAGHIAMAVWHKRATNQTDVLPRMWGRVD
jgi:cytochrome b561